MFVGVAWAASGDLEGSGNGISISVGLNFLPPTDFLILNCMAQLSVIPRSRAEHLGALACVKTSSLCGTMLPDHPDSLEVAAAGPDVQSERVWALLKPSGSRALSKRPACP